MNNIFSDKNYNLFIIKTKAKLQTC